MAILSNEHEPDDFESHNCLKLSFTNVWGLCPKLVDCESLLESNPPSIVAHVRQTRMTQLILAISLGGVIFL